MTNHPRLTCQCCGRDIMAKTGVIAHHGYTRPEQFWQTASCIGARYLPFEVNRDRLGYLISIIERQIKDTEKHLADVQTEKLGCAWTWGKRRVYGQSRQDHHLTLDRIDFTAWTDAGYFPDHSRGIHSFEDLLKRTTSSIETNLRMMRADLRDQQKRYADWKPTLTWDKVNRTWSPI